MEREDRRADPEAERLRRLRDRDRDDYGQADYSNTYGYDPQARAGYRAFDDGRGEPGPRPPEDRYARTFDTRYDRSVREGDRDSRPARRGAPSDRVLWAVIMERLDDHRIDLRDVDVDVRGGEVTLNGLVRRKSDKRRIEDIADIDGVRHVQNNLRVRESDRRWVFF